MTQKAKEESAGERFVGFVLLFPAMFLSVYVISQFWGWFAVPLGLPMIGYAHLFGFRLLTFSLAGSYRTGQGDGALAVAVHSIVYSLFGWALGAIAHGFMA